MSDDVFPARPHRTVSRTPWGHVVVIVLATVGLVLNIIGREQDIGGPVEDVMSIGISIDLVAAILACAIGLIITLVEPWSRPAIVFPWLGLGFSVLAFGAWILNADGLFETLFFDGRGRYMFDTAGPFYAGIPWVLGAVFSSYGLRRQSSGHRNAAAITGIALWGVVLVGAIASALLYGADLTD